MAQKVLLKDANKNEILPITRGELVLDSSGNPAFHSSEFLATTSKPGLMSKEDKYKIDNLSSIGDLSDEKVKQITTDANESYRLLFSSTADDITRIEYTGKSSKLLYNPSTGSLISPIFIGDLTGNATYAISAGLAASVICTGAGDNVDRPIVATNEANKLYYSSLVKLNYSTGNITAPKFTGNLVGNADSATNADKLANLGSNRYYHSYSFITNDDDLAKLNIGSYAISDQKGGTNPVPIAYSSLSVLGDIYYLAQLCVKNNASSAYLRGITKGSTVEASEWHQLAFIDSNVASATKLETARTIWGQSFDGTANVTGDMSGVGKFSANDRGYLTDISGGDINVSMPTTSTDGWARGLTYKHLLNESSFGQLAGILGKGSALSYFYYGGGYQIGTHAMRLYDSVYNYKAVFTGNVTAPTFIGELDGTYVNKLTGYAKAATIADIIESDSLNTALGKLELKAETTYELVKGAYDGDGTIENLAEILKVLEGISDTETIQAIIGKYLPLSGGDMNNNAVIKFTKYGNRRLTISGNELSFDYSGNSGGWSGGIFLTDSQGTQHSLLQWSGDAIGLKNTVFKGALEGNADSANVISKTYLDESINYNRTESKIRLIAGKSANSEELGYPRRYTTGLSVVSSYAGWQMVCYGSHTDYHPYYRSVSDSNVWGDWKQIAFITDIPTKLSQLTNDSGYLTSTSLNNYVTLNTEQTITGLKTFESNSSSAGVSLILKNKGWSGGMSTAIDFYNGGNKTVPSVRISDYMNGDGSAGGTLRFYTQEKSTTNPNPNGLTERMRITNTGTVGIGTTDPEAKLHIDAGAVRQVLTLNSNNSLGPIMFFKYNNEQKAWFGYSPTLKGFYIFNSNDTGIFINDSNNIGIGTTTINYKLHVNGKVASTGFVKSDSSDSYVLLGGGGHKALSDFMLKSDELTNNLTTITKTLTVTKDWMDTGIDGDDFETGTYAVQLSCNHNSDVSGFWDCYWSGIMSWWKGRTNDTDTDEIVLHRAGRYYNHTLYLRTVMRSNTDGNGLKLQIAASSNIGVSCTYTFKFKKLI